MQQPTKSINVNIDNTTTNKIWVGEFNLIESLHHVSIIMVPAVAAWPREDGLLMLMIHDTDTRTSVISSRRVPTSGSGLYASKYDHIKGI